MRTLSVVGHRSRRRAIHLLDVENLLEGPDFTELEMMALMETYSVVSGRHRHDHVVIATCHRAALAAWFGCPEARRLVRSGPDGADLALLDVIARESLHHRYEQVFIGSGDGAFAEQAARLQRFGTNVSVVSREAALSRRLRFAVRDVRYLDVWSLPAEAGGIA